MLNISLILDCPNLGVFLGKKTIAPRYTTWSLPGAQVTRTTAVDSGLIMIGRDLLGIDLDPSPKHFIAAYSETLRFAKHNPEVTACYVLKCHTAPFQTNPNHFNTSCFVATTADIPTPIGNMCRYFLEEYFDPGEAKRRVGRALGRFFAGS